MTALPEYLIIEAKKGKLSTVPECCATEYSLTPPDSPTTNDGGPKLNKKKKSAFHCSQANNYMIVWLIIEKMKLLMQTNGMTAAEKTRYYKAS